VSQIKKNSKTRDKNILYFCTAVYGVLFFHVLQSTRRSLMLSQDKCVVKHLNRDVDSRNTLGSTYAK